MTSKEPQPGGSRDVLKLQDSEDDFISESEVTKVESNDESVFDLHQATSAVVQEEIKPLMGLVTKLKNEIASLKGKGKGKSKGKGKRTYTSDEDSETETDEETRALSKRRKIEHSHGDDRNIDEEDKAMFVGEEELGEELDESTVVFLKKRFEKEIKEEHLTDINNKYKTPSNAKFIKAPKTNKEIWRKLNNNLVKKKDKQLLNMNENIAKATICFSKLYESVPREMTEIRDNFKDGLTLLAQTAREFDLVRRDRQRFSLPPELRSICNSDTQTSNGLLYGENIEKKIKEVQEKHKHDSDRYRQISNRVFLGQKKHHQHHQQQHQNGQYQKNYNNKKQFQWQQKKSFWNKGWRKH